MTSMKDFIQVEVTGDDDAVTSELYVENTTENPAWYTVGDNHVSLVSENIEKVIKLETDVLDDCMWESRIEITKYVDNQSNMELPLEYQDVVDNNIYLNHDGNTSNIIFPCNICGKSFVLNYLLKNHMAEHKRLVHYKTNNCKFCGKQFKLKFGLNRHIQKHHNSMCATIVSTAPHTNIPNNDIISHPEQTKIISSTLERNSSDQMYKCNLCGHFIDCSKYIEHKKYHERRDSIVSIVRDTPYFCIRKSSTFENGFGNDDYDQTSKNKLIFTCRICKNSPSTDIHSFALHMSDHRECNMHECIVCDKTFSSVLLWTAHMTNHQQQIDLNVSTVQFNLLESESNTFDTNIENIKLEPNVIQNSISIEDNNTDSATMSRNQKNETKSSSIKKRNITNELSVPVINKNYNLSNHVNKSNEKKSTFCIICNKHFAHLGALTNHKRVHVEHPCDVCEKKYSTPYQLKVHKKSHSKLKIEAISHKDEIKCRYCKIECNSISQWKNHMSMSKECRRHCKSYVPEFTSNKTVLDKTYLNTGSQKDKLMDIIQQKPAIKKRNRSKHFNGVKCELCDKLYCNEYNLMRHISMIHKQIYKPVSCYVCGITLKNKFSYDSHLRNTHKKLFKHYEETNSTYKNTTAHICEICEMKFPDNITLQKHTKIHTLNMYKCNDCGQQYETNLSLGNHILENHSAENYETKCFSRNN